MSWVGFVVMCAIIAALLLLMAVPQIQAWVSR